MKTITVDGKRYRLSLSKWHNRVEIAGPGLLIPACLPEGVTLETQRPVLLDACRVAIAEARQRRLDAGNNLRRAVFKEE